MANKLQIKMRDPATLQGYENNARLHDEAQIAQIVASITEFGFTNPILVDEHAGIIAGHGRLAASLQMGLEEVPTIELAGLSDAQKRAYVIADNKLAENATWDESLLALELSELQALDFDTQLTGFSLDEVKDLFSEDAENFARNVESPLYEPTGECPAVSQLCDDTRTQRLKRRIKEANIPKDVKRFLNAAAERHTVFNFGNIAEFYAHADADVQSLMEESALVIIDFNQAVEEGFVRLTNLMTDLAKKDEADE